MENLADLLTKTRRSAEGEALEYRALAILEDSAGGNPMNLIKALANAAQFQIVDGDLAGGQARLERAIGLYESAFPAEPEYLGRILKLYAGVLRRENRVSEARGVDCRAARILADAQRENHLGYTVDASSLRALADTRGHG